MSNFTFKYYKEMLQNAIINGYEITPMKNHNLNYDKHLLIRHDVDFTLENAIKFSDIEDSLGVKSTYFIRLNSKNYNPFSIDNSKIINKLIKNNHEIGLHIEPDFYNYMNLDYIKYINHIIEFFSITFNTKIYGISTHEPARCGYIIDKKNIKLLNIDYEAYLLDSFKYISDSGARWREGDLNEWVNRSKKIIMNTHPIWWYDLTPLENY
jgi:hypothetical protein